MSEEEMIQHFEFIKSGIKEETKFIDISILECFEDLLDLYNKEKEKNKILELAKIPYLKGEIMAYKENTVSKDKIIEKIEECEEAMNKVKQFNPSTYSGIDTFIYAMAQRNILKSLLEEE